MTRNVDRLVHGVTTALSGDDLQVFDYRLTNERRTRCRLILRDVYRPKRASAAAIEAEDAPFGTYLRKGSRERRRVLSG